MMELEKIEFYVGTLKEDFDTLKILSEKAQAEIINSYDDPYGYFVSVLRGTWDSYKELSTNPLVKSIEHFQE
jgi:hypothetical protein